MGVCSCMETRRMISDWIMVCEMQIRIWIVHWYKIAVIVQCLLQGLKAGSGRLDVELDSNAN